MAGSAAEGVLMTFAADPIELPEAKAVVEEIRARGSEPEGWTLYSYMALQVVAAAIQANGGSNDGAKLGAYLKSHTIDTIMGPQEWDEKGDPKVAPLAVYRWEKQGDSFTYNQIR